MSEDEYKSHLATVILALVRKHSGLTIIAIYEMANQLIVQHGVRDAAKFV